MLRNDCEKYEGEANYIYDLGWKEIKKPLRRPGIDERILFKRAGMAWTELIFPGLGEVAGCFQDSNEHLDLKKRRKCYEYLRNC
jgi:hypothetical protein